MPGWLESRDATRLLLIGTFVVSLLALGVALAGENVFGIQPCILCIYQRVPYVVTALVAGAAAALRISSGIRRLALVLCGVVFTAGAVLAFYSVGVEEHWWSGIAGCEGTAPPTLRIEDLQAELAQPSGLRACDENVWRMFGLSLAAYNVAVQVALLPAAWSACSGSRDTVLDPDKGWSGVSP